MGTPTCYGSGKIKVFLLTQLVDRIPANVLTNPNSESADRILSVLAAKSRPNSREFRLQARYPSPFAAGAGSASQSQPTE